MQQQQAPDTADEEAPKIGREEYEKCIAFLNEMHVHIQAVNRARTTVRKYMKQENIQTLALESGGRLTTGSRNKPEPIVFTGGKAPANSYFAKWKETPQPQFQPHPNT
jgi:hypothetical protein